MDWCEEHGVDYVLGLARNARLEQALEPAPSSVPRSCVREDSGEPERVFEDLTLPDLEELEPGAAGRWQGRDHPARARIPASSSPRSTTPASTLARSTRRSTAPAARWRTASRSSSSSSSPTGTSARLMSVNQLRLWLSSLAYPLLAALRRLGLAGTACPSPLRHDPLAPAQDRRPGANQRTTDRLLLGQQLSPPGPLRPCFLPAPACRAAAGLKRAIRPSGIEPTPPRGSRETFRLRGPFSTDSKATTPRRHSAASPGRSTPLLTPARAPTGRRHPADHADPELS